MAKYTFVVMTNAAAGQEGEFNSWYERQHIPDVLRIEGFRSAQRFQLAPEESDNPKGTFRYLTLYEIETDDLSKTKAAIAAAAGSEAMPMSPALDRNDLFAVCYRQTGEKIPAG